jgi:hypothetical protein
MWLFTESGFISAVRKHDHPNVFTVRSRDRKSLEPLAKAAGVEIWISPYGDYPYRAFVEPKVFAEWVETQAMNIDYDNFKNHVAKTRGYDYTHALHDVWVAMLATEDSSREELIEQQNK